MATSDGGIWSFSSLSELHERFGWEEYLVLSAVLLISVLIGKPVGPVEILGQVTKFGVPAFNRKLQARSCWPTEVAEKLQ